MEMPPLADLKDGAAIASSLLSPAIAAAVTMLTMKQQGRERVSARIVWQWRQQRFGDATEKPVLVVHNRSSVPIAVVDLRYATGIVRRVKRDLPIEWEEPEDIHFPYTVAPGATREWQLDDHGAGRLAARAGFVARGASFIGRHYLWIRVETLAGTRVMVPAADATPFKERPAWIERLA